jgi:hypothetical protein
MSMKREKVLETMLAISLGLVVLSVVFHARMLIGIAVIVGIIGLFIKPLAEKIAWLWVKLAEGLGFVTSKILLSLVFFLVLVPVALLHRLSVKNHLQLKRSTDETYYVVRNHRYTPKDFENTW